MPGDELWVSGTLGDARLALEAHRGTVALPADVRQRAQTAMDWPQPRVAVGRALRGLATAAMDVSDGLAGDVRHLLQRSRVGAVINADAVPRSADLAALPLALQRLCCLSGGDDYELLFTVPAARHASVQTLSAALSLPLTCIGRITAESALRWVDHQGATLHADWQSFDHFKVDLA